MPMTYPAPSRAVYFRVTRPRDVAQPAWFERYGGHRIEEYRLPKSPGVNHRDLAKRAALDGFRQGIALAAQVVSEMAADENRNLLREAVEQICRALPTRLGPSYSGLTGAAAREPTPGALKEARMALAALVEAGSELPQRWKAVASVTFAGHARLAALL